MNEILQKRIEEAATFLFKQRGLDKESCRQAMDYILANQWISVEEALPEDKTKVFVIVKTPVGIVHRADYHINNYWYMNRYSPEEIVTHWMPIPEMKGGEK